MELAPGYRLTFPGGRTKALSMSYDDGSEHDRRLVALFNAHGLKATFHLPSASLGEPHRVTAGEVARLYAGHEVACHGATHADLTRLDDAAVREELASDRAALGALTGAPVRGLAYAYGAHDGRIERLAGEAGFAYARGVTDTRDFALPTAPLALTTTCHHGEALAHAERLIASSGDQLRWMRVRGHSYEFDGFMTADRSKDWSYLETFCRLVGGDAGIWHAPLLTVLDYLAAAARVVREAGGRWRNPSAQPVWVRGPADAAAAIPPDGAAEPA